MTPFFIEAFQLLQRLCIIFKAIRPVDDLIEHGKGVVGFQDSAEVLIQYRSHLTACVVCAVLRLQIRQELLFPFEEVNNPSFQLGLIQRKVLRINIVHDTLYLIEDLLVNDLLRTYHHRIDVVLAGKVILETGIIIIYHMVVDRDDQRLVFPQAGNHAKDIEITPAVRFFREVLEQALDRGISINALVVTDLFEDFIVGRLVTVTGQVIPEHQIAFSQQAKDTLLIRIVVAHQPDLEVVPAHHLLQSILHTILAIFLLDVKL